MLLHSDSSNAILVLGCQRSGTTLLNHILGSHPGVQIFDHDMYHTSHVDIDDMADEIIVACRRSRCCVKGPQLVWYRDWLEEKFAGAKILWIFRDPAETVVSMLGLECHGVPWLENYLNTEQLNVPDLAMVDGETDAEMCASIWGRKNRLGLDFDATFIHYHDLCHNPEPMIRSICSVIELEFNEQMLSHHKVPAMGRLVGGYVPAVAIHKNEKVVPESLREVVKPITTKLYNELLNHRNRTR